MVLSSIKHLVAVIFICVCGLSAKAQQVHFVYLQTENGQPFYVKFNNKVLSSSTAGYLIISKLLDGEYTLIVGFPKNEFPEESFQFSINNNNEGFLLKNFYEKGWGLFNMGNYNILMGSGGNTANAPAAAQNLQNDPFSKMLANVVKDSTILQKYEPEKPIAVVTNSDVGGVNKDTTRAVKTDSLANENSAAVPLQTEAAADTNQARLNSKTDASTVSKSDTSLALPGDQKPVTVAAELKKTDSASGTEVQGMVFTPAKKYMSKKGNDGIEMIYVDPNQKGNDTVRIFMPAAEKGSKPVAHADAAISNENMATALPDTTASLKTQAVGQSQTISTNTNNTTASTSSPSFIENINSIENKDTAVEIKSGEVKTSAEHDNSALKATENTEDETKDQLVVLPQVVQSSTSNSDCKAFADNEDFLRLRKKMASENHDDQMIKIAKKYFHSKCYSTEQIKNLSYLFLSNEGKYRFLDAAYPFASDSQQYKLLQSQLTDSYYINRFKAMIHK